MRRGQFVVVATSGDYGKPRPALVVQSDLFAELPSVVICPLTTTLRDDADQFRSKSIPRSEMDCVKFHRSPSTKSRSFQLPSKAAVLNLVSERSVRFQGL